jgi:serine/threonine protein kinase
MTEKNQNFKDFPKTERNHFSKHKDIISEKDILEEFIIGETLGKGTFGKVKLGIHKITGEKVNNKK